MREQLKPTLWRTARALGNAERLNLLRLVDKANGARGVVEIAEDANLPVPTASIYLRALNARGLISVVRSGAFVYYGTRSDRSLPVAARIQAALLRLFARKSLPADWAERLLPLLKAYANPRRENIVQLIGICQPVRYADLRRRAGLGETSFLRHLAVLLDAGVVSRNRNDGSYSLSKPANSLSAAFLAAIF